MPYSHHWIHLISIKNNFLLTFVYELHCYCHEWWWSTKTTVGHTPINLTTEEEGAHLPPTFKCTFFHSFSPSYFFFAIGPVWNVCLYCLFEIFWNYCDISIFLLMAFKDMIRSVILFVWIVLWSIRMGVCWVRHFVCKRVVLKYSFMTLQSIYTVWKVWP